MKNKKRKNDDLEQYDNISYTNMNVPGMRGYRDPEKEKQKKDANELNLSPAERRAMIKGAYAALLPMFLIALAVFCAAFGLIMLYIFIVK
ncbi:MAG: hypothetical protein ACI3XS_00820 [Eubacteriales bacterium]